MKLKRSDLFHHRIPQVIILSTIFLQVGVWVRNFAILLFIMDKTKGNSVAVSLISVAEYAPIFVFSFLGGTFADRWRPKRTMIWCDLLSSLSIFIVLFTLIFATWKSVFIATLISATISQFSQPAGTKLFKTSFTDEQIKVWLPAYQTIIAVFFIIGPVIGTYVFQNFGINVSILVSGIIFILSAATLLFLPADPPMKTDAAKTASFPALGQEMLGGVRYVFSKKVLTILGTCLTVLGLGSGLTHPLGIFIITEKLGLAKEYFQWFLFAWGTGIFIGGITAMAFFKILTPQKILSYCFLADLVGLAVLSWSPMLWVVLVTQLCLGIVFPFIQISIQTLVIQNTDAEFIGRVSGLIVPMYTGTFVLAVALTGLLKQATSLTFVYLMSTLLFLIALLLLMPIHRLPKNIPSRSDSIPGIDEVTGDQLMVE